MKKYWIILMLIALWSPMAGWAMEINGDFNNDKKLTMEDVFIFKDILLNRTGWLLTQNEKDINKDGNIDVADLAYLIKLVRNQKEGSGLNVGIDGWEDSGEDWGGTVQAPALNNNFNTVNTLDYQRDRQAGFWATATLPYNGSITLPIRMINSSNDDIIAYKATFQYNLGDKEGEQDHPFSYDRFDNGNYIEVINPNDGIYYESILEAENRLTIICFSLDNSSILKAHKEEDLFRIRLKFTYGKNWEETEDERIWGGDEQFCGSDFTLFNHPFTEINISLQSQGYYKLTYILDGKIFGEYYLQPNSRIDALEVPGKEGYTFSGWEGLPETMPAEDLIIYGTYEINTYTVTYIVDDEVIRVDYVEYGHSLPEAPEAPKKEDYDFVGWSEIPQTMPAHDITVEGIYEYNAGLNSILLDAVKVDIFDIQGRLIKKDVDPESISDYVQSGVYIINRQKVLIK